MLHYHAIQSLKFLLTFVFSIVVFHICLNNIFPGTNSSCSGVEFLKEEVGKMWMNCELNCGL